MMSIRKEIAGLRITKYLQRIYIHFDLIIKRRADIYRPIHHLIDSK
jgi:hypothetical protein